MTDTAIEVSSKQQLAITADQLELAKNTIAKGLDNDEFELFKYNCHRQGIHPLDGLLIPIKRNDSESGGKRLTFVTTVDLLRSRAADTNEYAGSDDPIFEYAEGGKPESATVTVWRFVQGQKCSFTATARWQEYYPGDKQGFMWKTKPHVMIGKCAEGLALRKAFPKQLAGLYLEEELQVREPRTREKKDPPKPVGTVKCPECNAEGGHLPSCSKKAQPKQAPQTSPTLEKPKENVMCGGCGQYDNKHEKGCKYAPSQPEAETTTTPASGLKRIAGMILSLERKRTKQDKKGESRPYLRLEVVDPQNQQFPLYVWHQTPQEYLTDVVLKKAILCDVSVKVQDGKEFYSVENILEVGAIQWENNAPKVAVEDPF